MRVLKFAKIDILLCKSYMWILLFPVLVLAIVILEPDMNSLYGTIYCLFGGLVLASLPITLHDPRQTGGFTRLLPARQGDDIKGHFLFSFLFLLLFLILSLPAAGLGGLFKGETAALLYTAGSVAQVPHNLFGSGRTLAVHMYVLSSEGLHMNEAYATAVVLLVVVLALNGLSDLLARKLLKGRG